MWLIRTERRSDGSVIGHGLDLIDTVDLQSNHSPIESIFPIYLPCASLPRAFVDSFEPLRVE